MDLVVFKLLWGIHLAALLGLALYGVHRLWFLWLWYSLSQKHPQSPATPKISDYPYVTIQLPIYNERFVAKRLIDATARVAYPRNRFEIQVLDDSSDDTSDIISHRAAYWQAKGISINIVRRKSRQGFKAGALANGMKRARGEFIAIFDADFVPDNHFLLHTIPHFENKKVGMVQCRWAFLNAGKSWLTRIQSLLLESHFRIEHQVRYRQGYFFNFNGTAGIWRKATIDASGGWKADTLTEDLDLSYRAQLRGWRFIYLDDHVVFSELPTTLSAFRSQQQRWTKGSIQTAKKILPKVLASKKIPRSVKFEAIAHLTANMGWLLCFILILTLYPAIMMNEKNTLNFLLKMDMLLFFYSSGAVIFYFLGYALFSKVRSGFWIPLLPLVSIGMAPILALSVLSGLFKAGGIFLRTPKYGNQSKTAIQKTPATYHRFVSGPVFFNFSILLYTLIPVFIVWQSHSWLFLFPLFFPVSLALILLKDIQDRILM